MKNIGMGTTAIVLTGLALSLPLLVVGCAPTGSGSGDPVGGAGATQASTDPVDVEAEPTGEGLAERSAERWALISEPAEDWIQVYEYMPPSLRATFGLYEFLDGKAHHHYKNVQPSRLMAVEGTKAYVEVTVTWWTTHPQVTDAIKTDEDFGDVLDIVEQWEWEDGQWWWVENHRRNEFYREHPEYLKKD